MSTHQETVSFIWNIANLIRDSFKRSEHPDVILPFTVLRRIDCVIRPTQEAVRKQYLELDGKIENLDPLLRKTSGVAFYNTSKFNFDRLLDDHANIYSNFMAYYNSFSDEMRVEVLDNFKFRAVIDDLHKNNLLYLVIERFSSADLHPDKVSNHDMGYIFEELIRKFNEDNNENPGEHFTPREIIRLMVDLLLVTEDKKLSQENIISSIFDPCCGTGGMLTIAKKRILEKNPTADIHLFGQELNQKTYAVTKSDMLMLNPDGVDAARIQRGSSLSKDAFPNEEFHYLIANPPYGKNWDLDKSDVLAEHELGERGRFAPGVPKSSDGQMLFILSMISKMRPASKGGSRIAVVTNGSPLYTGDANSGESEIRRYIIENDLLETIVALPEHIFYNTAIPTFIWIITNRKSEQRKGKIQIIDASGEDFSKLIEGQNLGDKSREMDENHIKNVLEIYGLFQQSSTISKIYSNEFFRYRRITVQRPLQINILTSDERIDKLQLEKQFTKLDSAFQVELRELLANLPDTIYLSQDAFVEDLMTEAESRSMKIRAPLKRAIIGALGEHDSNAEICKDKQGNPMANITLQEYERVPHDIDIDDYMEKWIWPYVPDAWVDTSEKARDKTTNVIGKIGYEINFNRYFYTGTLPKSLKDAKSEILRLKTDLNRTLDDICEEKSDFIKTAVTKGLNPDASMKDSGIKWIGQIPEHWEVVTLRNLFEEIKDKNHGSKRINFLSLVSNKGIIPYEDKGRLGNKKSVKNDHYLLVNKGDFVINSMNFGIGGFGVSDYDGITSPAYVVLRSNVSEERTRFLELIFQTEAFQKGTAILGDGILELRRSIGWKHLKNQLVPMPPKDECVEITSASKKVKDDLLHLDEILLKFNESVKEYKKSYILAAISKSINI